MLSANVERTLEIYKKNIHKAQKNQVPQCLSSRNILSQYSVSDDPIIVMSEDYLVTLVTPMSGDYLVTPMFGDYLVTPIYMDYLHNSNVGGLSRNSNMGIISNLDDQHHMDNFRE